MTRPCSTAPLAVALLASCAIASASVVRPAPRAGSPQLPIVTFLDWAERDLSFVPRGERHAYVVRALELMTSAGDVLIERGLGSSQATLHRTSLAARTRELAQAPASRHSKLARAAFADGAALIHALSSKADRGSAPHESRLNALARAGRAIDSSPLARQPEAIQRYFRHAAAAVRVLARAGGS